MSMGKCMGNHVWPDVGAPDRRSAPAGKSGSAVRSYRRSRLSRDLPMPEPPVLATARVALGGQVRLVGQHRDHRSRAASASASSGRLGRRSAGHRLRRWSASTARHREQHSAPVDSNSSAN
jgi:hypothetical protein